MQRGAAGTMRAFLSDEDEDEEQDEDGGEERDGSSGPSGRRERNKPAARGGVESSSVSVESEDEEDSSNDSNDNEDEDEEETEDEQDENEPPSSPEPDFILAEITSTSPTTRNPFSTPSTLIPAPLIHRILQTHFHFPSPTTSTTTAKSTPKPTTISAPARHLVAKYIEIFVKEAVRRCVDEKREMAQGGGGGGDEGDVGMGDPGWLEVEDLERVGGQLVMDF